MEQAKKQALDVAMRLIKALDCIREKVEVRRREPCIHIEHTAPLNVIALAYNRAICNGEVKGQRLMLKHRGDPPLCVSERFSAKREIKAQARKNIVRKKVYVACTESLRFANETSILDLR